MKIIEIVKINRELLKNLHAAGVRMEDEQFVDLYADYTFMRQHGEKVSYIVAVLANRYDISERTIYSLVKRFSSECNLFAV
nr:MAG TPA: Mor transcription activator family [Caudoviricetes sp.]